MFHAEIYNRTYESQKAHSRIPSKVQLAFSTGCYGFSLSADSRVHPTLCALNLFDTELYINLAQTASVRFEFNDYLY